MRSRLNRAFLPAAIAILILERLVDSYLHEKGVNPALVSAVDLIIFTAIVVIIVSYIAKLLGGQIDRAEAERSKYEEALKESEYKYQMLAQELNAILDVVPFGITLQSPDLKIIWANRSFSSFFEAGSSDLKGKTCYGIWHKTDAPCEDCPVQRTFNTGKPLSEITTSHGGRTVEIKTVPVKDTNGFVESVVTVGNDITDKLKLEEQLRHSQKMETIGTLTGGIAHDFNNILTAIIGYCHILLMKMKADDPLRTNVENIFSSSERAANLVQSLLMFGRKKEGNLIPVDLNEIIKMVTNLLSRLIGENIKIKKSLSLGELSIIADSGQIEQILMNLSVNARDAMPDGGILNIGTYVVDIDDNFIKAYGYGSAGRYACLYVEDTGIGMHDETRKRVFEPFFTTKEVGKGTGLGLSMVYGIVKQHNGYINVYSEPGKGTTFKICFPLSEIPVCVHRTSRQATVIKSKDNIIEKGNGEVILVAENDSASRELMKKILEEFNYRIIEAVNGMEAFEKFVENKDKIRLLITDVMMPGKNGKELYDKIKEMNPSIKVIFISGYMTDIMNKEDIFDKDTRFLSKPLLPSSFLKEVAKTLSATVH